MLSLYFQIIIYQIVRYWQFLVFALYFQRNILTVCSITIIVMIIPNIKPIKNISNFFISICYLFSFLKIVLNNPAINNNINPNIQNGDAISSIHFSSAVLFIVTSLLSNNYLPNRQILVVFGICTLLSQCFVQYNSFQFYI